MKVITGRRCCIGCARTWSPCRPFAGTTRLGCAACRNSSLCGPKKRVHEFEHSPRHAGLFLHFRMEPTGRGQSSHQAVVPVQGLVDSGHDIVGTRIGISPVVGTAKAKCGGRRRKKLKGNRHYERELIVSSQPRRAPDPPPTQRTPYWMSKCRDRLAEQCTGPTSGSSRDRRSQRTKNRWPCLATYRSGR